MELRSEMSLPKKVAPDFRYHVGGQTVVSFNSDNFYLGPHDSPESKVEPANHLNIRCSPSLTPIGGIKADSISVAKTFSHQEARDQ